MAEGKLVIPRYLILTALFLFSGAHVARSEICPVILDAEATGGQNINASMSAIWIPNEKGTADIAVWFFPAEQADQIKNAYVYVRPMLARNWEEKNVYPQDTWRLTPLLSDLDQNAVWCLKSDFTDKSGKVLTTAPCFCLPPYREKHRMPD